MTLESHAPVTIHGWTIYLHPLFRQQLAHLQKQVDTLRRKDPTGYHRRNATKRLAAIGRLAFDVIPQDPMQSEYRQGGTLGEQHKHWFRARFFQYRLFFRYHAASKIIVIAWVNGEDTKRAYESEDDAYRVFRKMLDKGNPPDDWDALIRSAKPGK